MKQALDFYNETIALDIYNETFDFSNIFFTYLNQYVSKFEIILQNLVPILET